MKEEEGRVIAQLEEVRSTVIFGFDVIREPFSRSYYRCY